MTTWTHRYPLGRTSRSARASVAVGSVPGRNSCVWHGPHREPASTTMVDLGAAVPTSVPTASASQQPSGEAEVRWRVPCDYEQRTSRPRSTS
jgi:hypothetical protein